MSYSPIKGNDVSQQQAPIVVWKFTIEEEVLAIQEVWRNADMEKKKQKDKWPSPIRKENLWFSIKGTIGNEQLFINLSHCMVWKWTKESCSCKTIQTDKRTGGRRDKDRSTWQIRDRVVLFSLSIRVFICWASIRIFLLHRLSLRSCFLLSALILYPIARTDRRIHFYLLYCMLPKKQPLNLLPCRSGETWLTIAMLHVCVCCVAAVFY